MSNQHQEHLENTVSTSESRTVLIVDDDSEFRLSLGKIMQRAGYDVSIANDGAQAIEMVGEHDYALILTDVHMPGMSGLALLKKIKAASPGSQVIIITVSGEDHTYKEAMMSGAFAFLNKPVKMKKVLTYARMALQGN